MSELPKCVYTKGPGKGEDCPEDGPYEYNDANYCRRHMAVIMVTESPRGGAVAPRGGTDTPAGGAEGPRGGAEEPRGGLTHPRGGAVEPPDA